MGMGSAEVGMRALILDLGFGNDRTEGAGGRHRA